MSERYKRNAGCIFNIKYHLVWCPKYRKPVLIGGIPDRLKELLNMKAQEMNINIEVMEVQPEHVHVFITGQPTEAIQHIVNQLKGYSSRMLRSEFPELRSKLPCLWSRSYYAGTVGHVSEYTVRRYIKAQKGK
jgi:putative transposase